MKKFWFLIIILYLVSCSQISGTLTIDQIEELEEMCVYKYTISGIKVKHEKGILFGDKLVGYYNGNVELGIDLSKNFSFKVNEEENSVDITAKIVVLNSDGWFIKGNETKYQEIGTWSNEERAALDEEGNKKILEECISGGGIEEAEGIFCGKFVNYLKDKMGFDKVTINFVK